jgi:hypothetical protein
LKRLGTNKVVEVVTVSEEALALFALEDKYEFWFTSYHKIHDKELPNPHPKIAVMNMVLGLSSNRVDDEEIGNDGDYDDSNADQESDSDDDESNVNKSLGGRRGTRGGMRRNKTDKNKGTKTKKRSRRKDRNNSESSGDHGVGSAEDNGVVLDLTDADLGLKPRFTSGKPQAWPLAAKNRFNDWCAFLETHRRNEDQECERIQIEIDLNKCREDYLGIVVKNNRGKRSLLEMMGEDEDEVRSRVGSIFDNSRIPGTDLSGVGTVYSKYNAKYVDSNMVTINGV